MFKRNKRRDESAFLYLENGEVKDSKTNKPISPKMNVRLCDDFSDEELNSISLDLEKKEDSSQKNTKDENIIKEVIEDEQLVDEENDDEYDEDDMISDMKATIFNILKFVFIFSILAILGFAFIKLSPSISEKIKNYQNPQEVVDVTNSDNSITIIDDNDNVNDNDNDNFNNSEYQEIKISMETMNTINIDLENRWNLLKKYCTQYSNGSSTIYTHKKNMANLQYEYSQAYLNFINTEDNYKTDIDKQLFDLYKLRYSTLNECMSIMLETNTYNRNSIIDKLNEYVMIDNEYNEKEFDILIEKLNEYNLSYTITDTQIILNK